MEIFKADILSVNKKGQWVFYLSLSIILFIIIVFFVLQIIPVFLQVFSIMIWLIAVLRYFLQTKKQILKNPVGEFCISDESISLFDHTYFLPDITSIKISISGWKSYKRSQDRNLPVSALHHGDKNFITVITKDENRRCEFFLTSREHWVLLRQHVLSWYCRDMNIIEDMNGARTYGLEYLNYKEIQAFKKNLQVSKMCRL